MDSKGFLVPETTDEVSQTFSMVRPTANVLVQELTRLLNCSVDAEDEDVAVATAQEVIFAGLLKIHTGTRDEFERWMTDRDHQVTEFGSEHVDHVAWHESPAVGRIVATTYQNEPQAAIGTLRRQVMGELYHEVL